MDSHATIAELIPERDIFSNKGGTMNWKLIVVGGLVFYFVMFILSMATGPLIHEGALKQSYIDNSEYWQPALNQDPPDMASLMPRWITTGLLTAFILAAVYGCLRGAFSGPGWKKGLWYGVVLSVIGCCYMAGWSGIFNLPINIWIWWGLEQFIYYLPAGAALGWVGGKLAPE